MKPKITFMLILVTLLLTVNLAKATIHNVEVADFSFTPNTLNIQSGDTVKWIWVSGNHTTTSTSVPAGAESWDNPVNSTSTEFQIPFTVSGTYHYKCTFHPTTMTGTITVEASSGFSDKGLISNSVIAYPCPFSDILSISLTVSESGAEKITIYDISGKQIRVLSEMNYEKGNYLVKWDGRNERGGFVEQGIYVYMIESKNGVKAMGKIVFNP